MVKNDDIEEVKRKAQTLIEALPYIKKFSGKKIVVKYGGSAMLDENLKFNVIQDVALLKLVGLKPIIVHGGGKEISKWIEKLGMETHFQNGLRVTDEPTLEVAEMVLNNVNRSLVGLMSKVGLNAVGISGKDAERLLRLIAQLLIHFSMQILSQLLLLSVWVWTTIMIII